jgi:DNA helicase-2/ATP-dependent DNA helicase PcrA
MVEEIQQLHRGGLAGRDRRALPQQRAARVIESALFNAGIPYRVYGGLRFFERAEIKHALAYLRLMENPHDDTSFLRVVNPDAASAPRTLENLQDAAGLAAASTRASARGRQGRRQPAAFTGADRPRNQTQGLTLREIIEQVLEPRAWWTSTAPRRKAPTASRTWRNWSTRPRPSSRRRASARTPWPAGGRACGTAVEPVPDAETGEIMSPLAAFLTHAPRWRPATTRPRPADACS